MLEGLPIHVDEAAIYKPCGNHIVAHWKGREFHIPISVAQTILARIERAIAKWHLGSMDSSEGVVRIGRKP